MAGGARRLQLDHCSRKSGTATTSGVAAKLLILDLGCRCRWRDEFWTGTASLPICFQFSVPDRSIQLMKLWWCAHFTGWEEGIPEISSFHDARWACFPLRFIQRWILPPSTEGGSFIEQTKTINVNHNVDKNSRGSSHRWLLYVFYPSLPLLVTESHYFSTFAPRVTVLNKDIGKHFLRFHFLWNRFHIWPEGGTLKGRLMFSICPLQCGIGQLTPSTNQEQ